MALPAALHKVVVDIQGRMHMRLGTGVTAKTASTSIWCLVALTFVAIFDHGPEKLGVILVMAGLELAYLFGTWVHTTINPHEPLEGPNLVAYLHGQLASKDQGDVIEGSAIIRDPLAAPSVEAITTDEPQNAGQGR